jgi:hypothetical protein
MTEATFRHPLETLLGEIERHTIGPCQRMYRLPRSHHPHLRPTSVTNHQLARHVQQQTIYLRRLLEVGVHLVPIRSLPTQISPHLQVSDLEEARSLCLSAALAMEAARGQGLRRVCLLEAAMERSRHLQLLTRGRRAVASTVLL